MNSSINDLKYIFEKNLKWKLNQKSKTSADEFRLLINTFKYYDYNPSGHIDKEQWKQAILKLGIIGFSEEKLNELFDYYLFNQNKNDINKYSDFLNYKQFGYDLLYNSQNQPNAIKRNNYIIRNKNTLKNINYSYDFKYKNKNNEDTTDKNIYNYRIKVNINNEQNIIKKNDENEEDKNITDYNNNNIFNNNFLNHSYNNHSYKLVKLKNSGNININDRNNNSINIKLFIKNIIEIFRAKINKDNGVIFYTLLQNLISNTADEHNSDLLSLSKLNVILKESNLSFTPKELQSLFCIIDFNDTGLISINKFLKVIKGNLNEFRKRLLIDIFNTQIDINKKGAIIIYYFKKLYNAKWHPDVLNKKLSESEIMTQFNYTFDIFCKIYKILGEINCSQFIKYYEGISASIPDDMYFKEIITNVWRRTNDFDETYFPNINNQNINFNLEKKINRSISTPSISYNTNKMNTIENSKNYNKLLYNYNNYNNYNNQTNLLNNSYFKFKNNTINNSNNNKILLKKINLTPINNNPKNTNPLILNDIQNNNMYNYKLKLNNNLNQYNNNINLNRISNNINNSIPHSNSTKYNTPNKYIRPPYIDNNIIKQEESYKNEDKDKYNYSQIILNSLRNILIKRGNKSIFYFQRMLTNCDTGQTGLISLSQLNDIFRAYNFNIYFYDIKLLFELFDKNKIGIIQYDNLIKAIVGKMNDRRKNLIIKIYEKLNKDLYGFINIKEIKKRYNCYRHPEFIKGNKTHEEIYGDFLECIEIYREYICNINKKNNNFFSYNEFLEFFDELSMYINDDNYFDVLILGCWDIK